MHDEWLSRQLLPPRGNRSVAEVVRDAGWIHTAGGTGVDLSLHARTRQREWGDDVFELPAVRESMMLVHRDDAPLALAAGRRTFADRFRKLDVDGREIDRTADRIAHLLGDSVLSIDELRAEVPSRSLGEPGRKLGLTSTLVVALRVAQLEGLVVRAGENRYRRAPFKLRDIADINRELAQRFIAWAAPTTPEEFAAWAGISKRDAKSALEGLSAPPPPAPSKATGVFFLPFRDNYTWFHRLEPTHHHTIVIDSEVAGWFDFDGERLVWRLKTGKRPREVAAAASELETFIREELGDLKHYAADNEKNRAARVAFVRDGE
jgi:winged helix DNA-binding protein